MRAAALRHAVLIACFAFSACSTSEALDPRALFGGQAASTPAQPDQGARATVPAVTSSSLRMEFAPVVGPTLAAATPLSRRLSQLAAERGIEIVAPGGMPGDFIVKGYLSAIADGNDTLVIFVWDVVDAKGTRLHRIQGQERIAGKAGADPWSAVPGATMEQIAARTIADIASWSTSRSG
ncbi:hypothetical protein EJC49_02410 [Aquibium carbonis]|uniref:Lipoprotein n=1 Tax=Aquibium carbonis TaxID=2495581 RepID=A0A3R9YCB4_9HYPH|nr:hypothetical protein [Aquibium carbonis]RST88012.1 hypothetical protein EJC49_02410 [Aquibium carbonis]